MGPDSTKLCLPKAMKESSTCTNIFTKQSDCSSYALSYVSMCIVYLLSVIVGS